MAETKLRPWIDEIVKDRTALEIYADPKNWRQTARGSWVFDPVAIDSGLAGYEIAHRALQRCVVPRVLLNRKPRTVYKSLTHAPTV